MMHYMKLNEKPFEEIKSGKKKIEFRLYDEKRRKISVGDTIEFAKLPELEERIVVTVTELIREESFKKLFSKIYNDKEEVEKRTEQMYNYYTREDEIIYGVLGIRIARKKYYVHKTYDKLVRDRVPNIIQEKGKECKYIVLDDTEYLKELNRKVIEEAEEFIAEDDIVELADLFEVLSSIMRIKGYNVDKVTEKMEEKGNIRGRFKDKVYLQYVDEDIIEYNEEN